MTAPTTKSYAQRPFRREPDGGKSEQFLAAVRRGADADELNALLAEIRCEQRLRRDAAIVAEHASHIAQGSALSSADVADLAPVLAITRQALERCA